MNVTTDTRLSVCSQRIIAEMTLEGREEKKESVPPACSGASNSGTHRSHLLILLVYSVD